jgi:hypothetical protein
VQWPVERLLPEREKLSHLRKLGRQVIILLDIGPEDGFIIGNAIENMRCGQAISVELPLQV